MTWAFGQLAAFDTETTGVNVETDRVVTATVVDIVPGADPAVASHLIAVDVDIPQAATDVHGVTTEHARENGKPPGEVLEAVASHLAESLANGVPIVGCNVAYDLTILDRELRRNGLVPLTKRLQGRLRPVIDVFVLDKALDRYRRGGRKLVDLCAFYGVKLNGAHDATADALGAARVAYRMCQRSQLDVGGLRDLYGDRPRQAPHIAAAFTVLGRMSMADLHAAQVGWYREQAESLAAYFLQQALEAESKANRAEANADEEARDLAENEARELRERAESVSLVWPLAPVEAVS